MLHLPMAHSAIELIVRLFPTQGKYTSINKIKHAAHTVHEFAHTLFHSGAIKS